MESYQVRLFGFPRIEQAGQPVPVNRRKMLALLAYLLVSGQPHSRDSLAAIFWPDFDTSSALANLRRDLSRLKEVLGEGMLRIERDKVQAEPDSGMWVDVLAFEASLREAEQHGHYQAAGAAGDPCPPCQAALEKAAEFYTDGFLAGFSLPDSPAFDEWQFFQAERLRGMLANVLIYLARWKMAQGAYDEALIPARRWLALDTLHEPAQRLVMQLYAWTGQPSAALRQYQQLVDLLQQELGAAPEAETVALYEAIRARRLPPPAPAAAPPSAPLPAQDSPAARFEIGELLSSGGFGEIFLGRDRLTGKPVAVKRLQPQMVARQPDVVKRFLREGEMLGRLSHPNIVPMLAFYEQGGQYNLVMDYLPGGSLRELLERENPLPLPRVLEIALELADALSRAHHLQILHRDLKPENILLDAAGHPCLIDFGLAMLSVPEARLTLAGMIIGSPAYMSPEAVRGQELDARSDIWSFGVLLFEMLAGRPPFAGEQFHALMQQILQEPPPRLEDLRPDIPNALARLVERMLEKDPALRLHSMRQAAAELEDIRSGSPTHATGLPVPAAARHAPTTHLRLLELPAAPTPLIGRDAELAQLHAMLTRPDVRLVTLTGSGGIGKTRLALEAAARLAGEISNGAVFVPLAPVASEDFVMTAVADAIHYRFSPGSDPKEQLLNYLCPLQLLLVMDNFEHLMPAVDLVAEILSAAPGVRLLVTSRERLNLLEEWVFEVNGLPYPPPNQPVPGGAGSWLNNFSAVQMFIERARRANPRLEIDDDSLADIIRICQLVEGMPLALELAAPWVRAMTSAEIAAELERGLDILTTSLRNLPERHRSLRVVFDQSWQSLSPAEQAILARFSLFHNGSTREAAERVTAARPANLMSLVDKALLRHRGSRFEMHELVRQYAAQRLAASPQDAQETRDRHHRYYLDLLARKLPWLKGGRQVEAANEITAEIDNIRAAWRSAVERGDSVAVAQAVEAYWLYCEFRGLLAQGETAFAQALEARPLFDGQPALEGFLRAAQGSLAGRQWQFERGRELMEQGLAQLREASPPDPEKTAFSLAWYAFSKVLRGQFQEAEQAAAESLTYFPATGDRWTQAGALRLLGASALYQGRLVEAEQLLNQCVAVTRTIGELRIRAYATSNLGVIHRWYGQLDQARAYFDEALRISISCNDRLSRADVLCEHGRFFLATGETERALESARTCIELYRQVGRTHVSLANIVMGKALRLMGDPAAEAAMHEGLTAARAVNHRPDIASGLEGLGCLALDRKEHALANRYFEQSLEIWTDVGNEPEIATLLCRQAHNWLLAESPDGDLIRENFVRALQIGQAHQAGTLAITSIVGLAALRLRDGDIDPSRAASLFLYARQHPVTPHEVRRWADRMLHESGVDTTQLRGEDLQALTWQVLAERCQRDFSLA